MVCKVEGSKGTICPIPAGKFKMGSKNGGSNEQPVREVYLSAFGMQQHPVTVGQYKAYLAEKKAGAALFQAVVKGCGANASQRVVGEAKNQVKAAGSLPKVDGKKVCGANIEPIVPASMPRLPKGFGGDNQPMVEVSWREARDYCRFRGMDLPTEAQWERAARGRFGDKEYGTRSGNLSHAEAVYDQSTTAPVCSKPKNDLGLCDMAGNVREWTLDWYAEDAYKTMAAKNPKGPSTGEYKVVRGDSSHRLDYFAPHTLRAAHRGRVNPGRRDDLYIGFRCVVRSKDSRK